MKKFTVLCAVVLMVLVLLAPVGCQQSTPDVVEVIAIFSAESGAPPPTSGWAMPGAQANPHPNRVQRVFSPGDKMFLGLSISSKVKANVTFSRFTYFNQDTGEEIEMGSPGDLMKVWEPGQVDLLAFDNPWQVPDESGNYQVRIYFDDTMIASAMFEVPHEIAPTPPPITSPPPPRTDWEKGSPPPEGIEGWEQPRPLTEDEKAEVVEIALSSQRASEWLQGRADYRVGSVSWYAIIWSNGEAGTWWSLEYARVANDGIPDFVSPYASWYPGVTIAVGEGTITQMQIAVDLDAGKVVMVDGPYPSLSSPDRFKNMLPPHPLAISKEQAIETAARGLPASIVGRADIKTEMHGWYWEITFDNLNAKADELMPFPLKPPPPAGGFGCSKLPESYQGVFQSVIITVDAQTGQSRSMSARRAPKPGPYISREQAIQSARERVLGFPMDVSWLGRAKVESYLQGDTWVVLFWEESSEDNRIKARVNAVTGEFTGGGRG